MISVYIQEINGNIYSHELFSLSCVYHTSNLNEVCEKIQNEKGKCNKIENIKLRDKKALCLDYIEVKFYLVKN